MKHDVEPELGLPAAYAAPVREIRALALGTRRVRLAWFGSLRFGECGLAPDGSALLSDLDFLALGEDCAALREVAPALVAVDDAIRTDRSPWFRVGVKFRTPDEFTPELMTANELSALRFGRWLDGGAPVREPDLNHGWFAGQAAMSVATRIAYDRWRLEELGEHPRYAVHRRYLAARVVLELPSAVLLLRGELFGTYRERVARFLDTAGGRDARSALEAALALRAGRSDDPAVPDFDDACRFLAEGARAHGIPTDSVASFPSLLRTDRRLDLRDREIWGRAGGAPR